ncbi:CocE/NonD family hydrolase [Streptococcus suis]|uniref:CocE/NonD family hydrolase n=1 Tax=Streptococcus suis TaxID=1307 RepID=A0A6L8MWL1_STRSU|nr:CocE/NonD family hydrolase [Streptococcus suis]NQI72971.1 CocE/NonD family hydrolase [Streptococcus suis]
MDNWTIQEAKDYAECIEQIAELPWCDGNIAGLGISYYAIMQWAVAAQCPPHLKAIIPFEGASDLYREFARHGGIGSDFVNVWYPLQVAAVQNGLGRFGQFGTISQDYLSGPQTLSKKSLIQNRRNYFEEIAENELIDADVYQRRQIDLSQIDIPVLSCGNWGGNALHLRGNTEGYLAIPSKDKFLEIHGLEHFTEFYTDYGRTMQQAFLDHYLKGKTTWHQAPVHLRLRNVDGSFTDRDEQEWPLARTQWTKYYLQQDGSLSVNASDDFQLPFQADSAGLNFFTEPLTEEREITGPAAASLLVSSSTQDADIFITLRVLDPHGNDISFVAANDPHGVVATGWLRASHRKLDTEKACLTVPTIRTMNCNL